VAVRRLPAPLHAGASRGRPVSLVVDGRQVPAFEGEPVAVALLAAGRPILSRSFRLHRPRGLMCSTGQCGWCECRIDGRPSVRSCRAAAVDGLRVDGEHAWPSVPRDALGALDTAWRWIPPTFYHHRFLRPKRLRKRYLEVIRRFGGRGRLSLPSSADGLPETPRRVRVIETDVAIVGGGPAGLLAARGAALAGARVTVIEAEAEVGGPWRWRSEGIPGEGSLDDLVAELRATGRVAIETGTTAASLDADGLHTIGPTVLLDVRAATVVVATGSHESLPLVPGNDRPGVMGARTVEWLIRRHGVVPGSRAVLVGDGPDLDRAADALTATGSQVVRRVAVAALGAIDGGRAVSGVRLTATGQPAERVAADLVVVGDRVPAAELAMAARSSGTAADVLLAGAAAGGPIDTAEAAAGAVSVGRSAVIPGARPAAIQAPSAGPALARLAGPAMVCFCEDVRTADLRRECAAGYGHPELLKRRTGALTGPCQGKYCAVGFQAALAATTHDGVALPALPAPTTRPPARPVRLGDLVALPTDEPGLPEAPAPRAPGAP
jgi:sarcosine oxidase subunit alpha